MSPGKEAKRRRPRTTFWLVPVMLIAVLAAAEGSARVIGPNIPRKSGSEERAFIKADQIFQHGGRTDVVIFGSSETAGGLIPDDVMAEVPELQGAYNAALPGARLNLTEEWADRIVLPQLDPKIVVISMLPSAVVDFSKAGFDPAEKTGPAYRSAFDQIDPGGLGSVGWQLRQRSALIRYRPYLRSPSKVFEGIKATLDGGAPEPQRSDDRMDWETETDPARVLQLTADDGEILDYRDASLPGGDDKLTVAAFNASAALPDDMAPLEQVIETVKASGAVPVVALAPIDRERLKASGADMASLDRQAERLAAWVEDHDVALFDSFEEEWPREWFHDRQHVAEPGARAWSKALGTWLAEQCRDAKLGDACSAEPAS
ncbi:MAG: hypothetical protein ACTHN0_03585 [Aquihabitans sp.]